MSRMKAGLLALAATSTFAGTVIYHRQMRIPRIPLQTVFPPRLVHPEEWRYHFRLDIHEALMMEWEDKLWSRAKMRWQCLKSSEKDYYFDGKKLTDPEELRALIGAEEVFKLAMKRVAATRPDRRVSSVRPADREDVRAEADRMTEHLTTIGVMTLL